MAVAALWLGLLPTVSMAAGSGITINEIRVDQPGTDNDEYFELAGEAGTSLDGLTYLVIGDGAAGSGVIEEVTDLSGHSLDGSGFFVAADATLGIGSADLTTDLNFENSDNVTHLLVDGFSGADEDDLDTDDDGTLDSTPWTSVVDSVALIISAVSGDRVYSPVVLGPDGSFAPGYVYDCASDGWQIGAFEITDDTPGEINVCDAPPPAPIEVMIHQVQGSGEVSPLAGVAVIVEGVVVGDFQGSSFAGSQLGGFFLQEEPEDQDSDPATSEGIFVFAPSAPEVSVGDLVQVTGTALEFNGKTEITDVSEVIQVGTDPAAVVASPASLPVADLADWEPLEGMLVSFDQDLFISEYFNFDRFGEIVLTDRRQFQPTQLAEPGSAEADGIAAANRLGRITLDDGRNSQNPDPAIHPDGTEFTLTNTFRGGDLLRGVTGVVDFGFGLYRIQPTAGATHLVTNPRPSSPDKIKGQVRAASFNVLNFFTTIDRGPDVCGPTGLSDCRGADSEQEYQRQLAKLVAGIIALDADIVGLQEVENDLLDLDQDGSRPHDAIRTLVEELNEVEGAGTWSWVGAANHYNDYPIRNEIIYRTGVVFPVGPPVALADEAFDQSLPGEFEPLGRPPLAQTFVTDSDTSGLGDRRAFTVVVNHFKSKGSSCEEVGDPDPGDGQGACNLTRVVQAERLLEFISQLQADTGDPDVLVLGDLNSYAREDPVDTLKAGLDGVPGTGDDLIELVVAALGESSYSFVFDGQLGSLDHALASGSLAGQVRGVTVFHINADELDLLDYDTSFKLPAQDALYEPLPYRVSDHDPIVIGLRPVRQDLPAGG
jgi:predicted extracellular nuclease